MNATRKTPRRTLAALVLALGLALGCSGARPVARHSATGSPVAAANA